MENHFLIQFKKTTGDVINVGVWNDVRQKYYTGDGYIDETFDLDTFSYNTYTMDEFFELIQISL
jgi:hypothetical protein